MKTIINQQKQQHQQAIVAAALAFAIFNMKNINVKLNALLDTWDD